MEEFMAPVVITLLCVFGLAIVGRLKKPPIVLKLTLMITFIVCMGSIFLVFAAVLFDELINGVKL